MQQLALEKEYDPGSVERLAPAARRAGRRRGGAARAGGPLGGREAGSQPGRRPEEADRRAADRGRPGAARGRPGAGQRDQLRRDPGAARRSWPRADEAESQLPSMVSRGGRPERHRRGRVELDRHPGRPAAAGREREAAADGGPAGRAADRPAPGRPGGVRRRTAFPRRHLRPEPADRLVPVPRPDRRRQDRAGEVAGGVPVRRRARHGPDRHERVLREALGGSAGRCPSGLRRLRGGWPAHRGRAAAPVRGRAAGRGGEGAQRGLRHLAAGARRRPADRRPGPYGRLPQRRS